VFVGSYFFLVILTSHMHLSMECKFPFKFRICLLDTFSQAWIKKANHQCESSCHSFRKYFVIQAPNVEGHQPTLEFGDTDPQKKGQRVTILVLPECTLPTKIQSTVYPSVNNFCGGRCFPSTGRRAILRGDAGVAFRGPTAPHATFPDFPWK